VRPKQQNLAPGQSIRHLSKRIVVPVCTSPWSLDCHHYATVPIKTTTSKDRMPCVCLLMNAQSSCLILTFHIFTFDPEIKMLESNAYRRLFGTLLTLPNLAAAFSSTSLLFLPGAPWNQDQRLVSSMGQVLFSPFSNPQKCQLYSHLLTIDPQKGCNSNNLGHHLHAQPHRNANLRYPISLPHLHNRTKHHARSQRTLCAKLVLLPISSPPLPLQLPNLFILPRHPE